MAIVERRAGVGLLVLLVCLVLGGLGSPAQAATKCSNQTVDAGRSVGTLTLRVVPVGRVSCAKARRVVRTYYRKMAAGGCGPLNNFCFLTLAGGWSCSIFSFGQSQTAGGAVAGCARGGTGPRIRLHQVRRSRHLAQFLSTGAAATCAQNWNPGAPILPLGQRNVRGGVGCTARPTGITCKLTGGRAKGKGFWISATGVAKLRR